MRAYKFFFVLVLVAAAFSGGWVLRERASTGTGTTAGPATAERKVLYYVDPMHPSYKSDKPGTAPDCGMALEPVYADASATASGSQARRILYYRDPKVPAYTATTPGLNPETGNTLEPVYADAPAASRTAGAVRIPADRQQLAGVRYATVEATDVGRTLRTVGRVAYDETKLQHVHPRVDGWIEKVHVDFTGQLVTKGQPMLTIYSPELLASQEELLLARRAREVMQKSPLAASAAQGDSLFEATRRRLQLWNLTEAQIQQVLDTGKPIRDITLYAPASGFVLERNAFPNQRVTAESDLYTLADLSTVWIMADLYEADLSAVRAGALARIVLPNGPATSAVNATVTYVQPAVDPTTRTLKVRLEARNASMRLRPEMFVDVEFPLGGNRRLTVPADAVLNSGERQVVFVDLGDGYLAPKTVQTAERVGDRLVVTSGLSEGERVVASGTFLIDAESQLKSALGSMAGHQHGGGGKPASAPAPVRPANPPAATAPPSGPSSGGHAHD
ncbi:efflux RND transporter periplasmic adaptor subunit [Luteitalea sp.]